MIDVFGPFGERLELLARVPGVGLDVGWFEAAVDEERFEFWLFSNDVGWE